MPGASVGRTRRWLNGRSPCHFPKLCDAATPDDQEHEHSPVRMRLRGKGGSNSPDPDSTEWVVLGVRVPFSEVVLSSPSEPAHAELIVFWPGSAARRNESRRRPSLEDGGVATSMLMRRPYQLSAAR